MFNKIVKEESITEKFKSMLKHTINKPKFDEQHFDFTKGDIENAQHGISEELLDTNRTDGKGFPEKTKLYLDTFVRDKDLNVYVYTIARCGDIVKSLEFINAKEFGEDSKIHLYVGGKIIETYLNNQEKIIPLNGYGIPSICLQYQCVNLIVYSKIEPEIYVNWLYCSSDYRNYLASIILTLKLSDNLEFIIGYGLSELYNKDGTIPSFFSVIKERGLPIKDNGPYKLNVPIYYSSIDKIQIKKNFLKNTTSISLYFTGNLIFKLDKNLLNYLIKSQLHSDYIDILSPFLQCIPNHLRPYSGLLLKIYNNKDEFEIDTVLYRYSNLYTDHNSDELLALDIKIPLYIQDDKLIYKDKKLKFLDGCVELEE